MNAALLLITTAWLATAGPGIACAWDGDDVVYDGGYDGSCCYDGGGGGYGWVPPGCGCQPAPRKEHFLKRLFHHHHEEPCRSPWQEPCFQDYYASSCWAATACYDCQEGWRCEKHGCLARLKRHFHHKERCLTPEEPPCWQPTCQAAYCCEPPYPDCLPKKHGHHAHWGLFHHHKEKPPAPCCPVCCAPCADCCSICSDGCCGAFDGWSGGGCTDCDCGPDYGGPAYGVKPKADTKAPPKAKPEKIGGPKTPPKGEDESDEGGED